MCDFSWYDWWLTKCFCCRMHCRCWSLRPAWCWPETLSLKLKRNCNMYYVRGGLDFKVNFYSGPEDATPTPWLLLMAVVYSYRFSGRMIEARSHRTGCELPRGLVLVLWENTEWDLFVGEEGSGGIMGSSRGEGYSECSFGWCKGIARCCLTSVCLVDVGRGQ